MTTVCSDFGPHLMLDCSGCDYEKISSLETVFRFLSELPEKMGMTKITQPYVFPYEGLIPEDKGITGIVIIAESHLTFHSFVDKDYFFFDAFSCKHFDMDEMERHVVETFGVKHVQRHHAIRGTDFPRSLEERIPLIHTNTLQPV